MTIDARHPRIRMRKKTKTHDYKWPVCLLLSLLALFWPSRPGYALSGLCLPFLTLYITSLFVKKMSFVFSHRTVNMISKRFCRNCSISSCGAKYLVRLATYSEVSIYKRQNCNLQLKSSFTKVKRIIPEKIAIAIQYRHKKRCTNCQDHGEMKPLLKQKLKEGLQRTKQSARNKSFQLILVISYLKLFTY